MEKYEKEIKSYCDTNSLDFEKVKSSPKCGNEQIMFVQHYDEAKAEKGLKNNAPADILLTITVDGGHINIAEGENAKRFLN